jgi:ferredoxin
MTMDPQRARPITRVWIAPNCIICNACEEHCPEVFFVEELVGSTVSPEVDPNDFAVGIHIAQDICPVDVIRVDYQDECRQEPVVATRLGDERKRTA